MVVSSQDRAEISNRGKYRAETSDQKVLPKSEIWKEQRVIFIRRLAANLSLSVEGGIPLGLVNVFVLMNFNQSKSSGFCNFICTVELWFVLVNIFDNHKLLISLVVEHNENANLSLINHRTTWGKWNTLHLFTVKNANARLAKILILKNTN
jgi:hypothetical protein